MTIRSWFLMLILLFPLFAQAERLGSRPIPQQTLATLTSAQTIMIEAKLHTQEGWADPEPVLQVIRHRMEEVGYTVAMSREEPHDIVLKVTCEEPNPINWRELVEAYGEFHSLPDGHPGPPCIMHYLVNDTPIDWHKVDRIIFSKGVQAAKEVTAETSGASPSTAVKAFLTRYEFPVLLAAEWGQTRRLLVRLSAPHTPLHEQLEIIFVLGEIRAAQAFPCLVDALKNEALIETATRALGNFGERSKPLLLDLLKKSTRTDVQASAAYSLGQIGAMAGDTSMTPDLLNMLNTPDVDILVKTEIVWALGKSPDFRAYPALRELEKEIWNTYSEEPKLKKLRVAVDWSIREVRQGGHTGDY